MEARPNRSGATLAQSLEAITPEELRLEGIREVVVATEEQRGLPMQVLLQYKLCGIRVTDYLTFRERECRCVDLPALQPSWIVYGEGCRQGVCGALIKRVGSPRLDPVTDAGSSVNGGRGIDDRVGKSRPDLLRSRASGAWWPHLYAAPDSGVCGLTQKPLLRRNGRASEILASPVSELCSVRCASTSYPN